jgi:hypothetical protein
MQSGGSAFNAPNRVLPHEGRRVPEIQSAGEPRRIGVKIIRTVGQPVGVTAPTNYESGYQISTLRTRLRDDPTL